MYSTSNTAINIAQFQGDIARILQQNEEERKAFENTPAYKELTAPSDLSVDDLVPSTIFQRVENLIDKIKGDGLQSAKYLPEIKELAELVNPPKNDPKSRKRVFSEKKKPKASNFITETMKVRNVNLPTQSIEQNEILIHVTICHHARQVKLQDFYVLGSQHLYELRDSITCLSDELTPEECKCPGSFFFIENVFYNDTRSTSSQEQSDLILDWVRQDNRFTQAGLGIFKSSDMMSVRFRDLTLRVGLPYLYRHQGDCEHLVIFNEIRLMHEQDRQNRCEYPLQTFQSKRFLRKCQVCNIYPSKFVTYNDLLAVDSPCFFCQNCYQPFHYSSEGRPLYDYTVFKYHYE